MQRSGQTAKTQSSTKAPGRGALQKGRNERAPTRRQQAGGSGSRQRSATGQSRGSDRRRHRSAPRYATLPRDLAGNFGVFLGQGRASSITHTAPAPAAARHRRDPGTGGRGRGSEKPPPAERGGYGAPRPGRANFGGGRASRPGLAEPPGRSRGCRPPLGGRGEGGGKSFSRGSIPTCDTSGTSVCSTERVRISSPASAPSPDEDDEETPLLLHGDVAIAVESGRDPLQPRRRRVPARAARARRSPHAAPLRSAPGPPPPPPRALPSRRGSAAAPGDAARARSAPPRRPLPRPSGRGGFKAAASPRSPPAPPRCHSRGLPPALPRPSFPPPAAPRPTPQPAEEGTRDWSRHRRSHREFPRRPGSGRGQTEGPCPRGGSRSRRWLRGLGAPRRRRSGPVSGLGLRRPREGRSRSGSVGRWCGARERQPRSRSLLGKGCSHDSPTYSIRRADEVSQTKRHQLLS